MLGSSCPKEGGGVYELVVCASLHNVGLESLESGFLVHGEMSWMMQRKEGGGRATK
jgi:hypothetical protein